jgi:hypothetical protein
VAQARIRRIHQPLTEATCSSSILLYVLVPEIAMEISNPTRFLKMEFGYEFLHYSTAVRYSYNSRVTPCNREPSSLNALRFQQVPKTPSR